MQATKLSFVTKKENVNANETYATLILPETARMLFVTEDGIAVWEASPRKVTCRSKAHMRYWLSKLDTSKGGLVVLFGAA